MMFLVIVIFSYPILRIIHYTFQILEVKILLRDALKAKWVLRRCADVLFTYMLYRLKKNKLKLQQKIKIKQAI